MSAEKTAIPFLDKLGATIHTLADGQAEVRLTVKPDMLNTWETLQGGVSMTMLDVAMGVAVKALDPSCISSATIEMQTHFLQPGGSPEDTVIARGKVYHRTRKLFFCEAELWNQDKLVAKSTGVFKLIKAIAPTSEG